MKTMGSRGVRVKAQQGRNDAAEQQPWRCRECNVPVRPGRGDPCRCTGPIYKRVNVKEKTGS
jgi:hypothetical protein